MCNDSSVFIVILVNALWMSRYIEGLVIVMVDVAAGPDSPLQQQQQVALTHYFCLVSHGAAASCCTSCSHPLWLLGRCGSGGQI